MKEGHIILLSSIGEVTFKKKTAFDHSVLVELKEPSNLIDDFGLLIVILVSFMHKRDRMRVLHPINLCVMFISLMRRDDSNGRLS